MRTDQLTDSVRIAGLLREFLLYRLPISASRAGEEVRLEVVDFNETDTRTDSVDRMLVLRCLAPRRVSDLVGGGDWHWLVDHPRGRVVWTGAIESRDGELVQTRAPREVVVSDRRTHTRSRLPPDGRLRGSVLVEGRASSTVGELELLDVSDEGSGAFLVLTHAIKLEEAVIRGRVSSSDPRLAWAGFDICAVITYALRDGTTVDQTRFRVGLRLLRADLQGTRGPHSTPLAASCEASLRSSLLPHTDVPIAIESVSLGGFTAVVLDAAHLRMLSPGVTVGLRDNLGFAEIRAREGDRIEAAIATRDDDPFRWACWVTERRHPHVKTGTLDDVGLLSLFSGSGALAAPFIRNQGSEIREFATHVSFVGTPPHVHRWIALDPATDAPCAYMSLSRISDQVWLIGDAAANRRSRDGSGPTPADFLARFLLHVRDWAGTHARAEPVIAISWTPGHPRWLSFERALATGASASHVVARFTTLYSRFPTIQSTPPATDILLTPLRGNHTRIEDIASRMPTPSCRAVARMLDFEVASFRSPRLRDVACAFPPGFRREYAVAAQDGRETHLIIVTRMPYDAAVRRTSDVVWALPLSGNIPLLTPTARGALARFAWECGARPPGVLEYVADGPRPSVSDASELLWHVFRPEALSHFESELVSDVKNWATT